MRRAIDVVVIGLFVQLVACHVAADENWPQFRGSDSQGTSTNDKLPTRWSATENVRWRTGIPGQGWSSPVVWGDKVFVTTVVNQGEDEEAKPGLYFGGERPDAPKSEHEWKTYCLHLQTGEVLWDRVAHRGLPPMGRHIKNSYASETPATDGQRVYAYFGNLGLYTYDLDGNLIWSRPISPRKTRATWGTGASAIVHNGRVFLVNDNEEESYVVALDAKTGDELWRRERDELTNWATPFIWESGKRTELVTAGTKRIRSYDLDGNLLWELGGMSSIAIPTPFARDGLLYLASGYLMDKQRPVFAVKAGATGDISPKEGETSSEYVAWCQPQAGPYNPSPVLYKDYLYVLLDRGLFACYDAATGQEMYEKKRIPNGKAFTSSPWAYDDKIFCLNEFGTTFVIKAGPEFEILYENELGEDVMCLATPALVGDKLLIRTDKDVICLEDGFKLEPKVAINSTP
jgi:outer membrane protein assembly factor BamB